jgi:glycine cleavage system H protein
VSTLRYTEEHEWLEHEGEIVTVGITEHAAEQLGDIVFIELPEAGTVVAKGDHVVTIESVKAASDIMAPIDGEIVEVNEALIANPALVNEDALGGWFFRMKPADPAQLDEYLDDKGYKDLIG